MPEDLLKFGLIPEFIGRLPVMVTLSALSAEDLVRVLTEPKNAVTRQFEKFLSLDKVELAFTPGALQAAAEVALDRKTGARALRSIVEESLLEVMYDIPERTDIRKCIITEETIRSGRLPLLLTKADVDKGVDETNYQEWLASGARRRRSGPSAALGRPSVADRRPAGAQPRALRRFLLAIARYAEQFEAPPPACSPWASAITILDVRSRWSARPASNGSDRARHVSRPNCS